MQAHNNHIVHFIGSMSTHTQDVNPSCGTDGPLRISIEAERHDSCRVPFQLHRPRNLMKIASLRELHLPYLDVGGKPCNQDALIMIIDCRRSTEFVYNIPEQAMNFPQGEAMAQEFGVCLVSTVANTSPAHEGKRSYSTMHIHIRYC